LLLADPTLDAHNSVFLVKASPNMQLPRTTNNRTPANTVFLDEWSGRGSENLRIVRMSNGVSWDRVQRSASHNIKISVTSKMFAILPVVTKKAAYGEDCIFGRKGCISDPSK
jgi:hypothetical protein